MEPGMSKKGLIIQFLRVSFDFRVQSNLDYPDSLELDKIVQIIEGPDNWKYEY